MSSSQDPPGTFMIQNLHKKEWTGLRGCSVPLENLQKIKYYSRLFHPPAKSPCQSIQSGFWGGVRAETTSSLLQPQIPGGHLSLQQPHCLQRIMEAFLSSTAPPADFSLGRDDLSPCDLGFNIFTLIVTVVRFPSGKKKFCFTATVEQLLNSLYKVYLCVQIQASPLSNLQTSLL